ncbi:MAG: hypothetical protein ACTSYA_01655 [Candidatus Kariarchaeaceae archaeon]
MIEEKDYDEILHGTTLDVYKFLLKTSEAVGVRELQRALGFSSPSISAHHLNKLEEWGICSKTTDSKYELTKKVKIRVLKHFVIIKGQFLPRFAFHVAFFSSMLLFYLIYSFYIETGLYDRLIGITTLVSVVIIMNYEALRLYRMYKQGF